MPNTANHHPAREAGFKLIDLTPPTRRLFRAYRDAEHAATALIAPMATAASALDLANGVIRWADAHPGEVTDVQRARYTTQLADAQRNHAAATRAWGAASEAASAAFRAALAPMRAEGYPHDWWYTGVMNVPTGTVSPGAWRRDPHLRRTTVAVPKRTDDLKKSPPKG